MLRALLLVASLALPRPVPQAEVRPVPVQAVMSSGYGEKLALSGIPNGGKINDTLYRGAQPRSEGLQQLKNLGVTTIIDLRSENPEKVEAERKQAEALGMRFVSIPSSPWSPPSNDQVAQFLKLFQGNTKDKFYVHCRFGEDRTGVFIATYRMAYEKWPAEQAIHEMYKFGFNGFWHPAMRSFVRDFPARLGTAPALSAFGDKKLLAPDLKH